MASKTTKLNPDQESLKIPDALLESVHVTKGEKALVLVSDGEYSTLYEAKALQTSNPHIPIDRDKFEAIDVKEGDTITYWVTLPEKLNEISLTEGTVSFGNNVTGNGKDPTGGTWLLIHDGEFGYSPKNDRVKGDITIYKHPYRETLRYTHETEFIIKAVSGDKEITQKVHPYKDRTGITITHDNRDTLNITKTNRNVTVWVDTESIASHTIDQIGEEDTTNGVKETEDSHTDEKPVSKTEDSVNEDKKHTDNTDKITVNTPEESDTNRTKSLDDVDISDFMDIDPNTELEMNPDFVPVVLVDTEERTRENWQAHYLTDDDELLCGKEYTDYIKDSKQNYYTDVCHICALKRPGAIPDKDISILLEKFTGLSFSDELPFMIDKQDAAKLLVQLTYTLSSETHKLIKKHAQQTGRPIREVYEEALRTGIEKMG